MNKQIVNKCKLVNYLCTTRLCTTLNYECTSCQMYLHTYLPFQNPFLFYDYVHFENSSIDFNCIFCTLFGCQISALVTFHNSLQSQCKIILILESVESFLDLNLEVYLLTEPTETVWVSMKGNNSSTTLATFLCFDFGQNSLWKGGKPLQFWKNFGLR